MAGPKFPTAKQLVESNVFNDFVPLLPARLLEVPRPERGSGHRRRSRAKLKREVIIEANVTLRSLNLMHTGGIVRRTTMSTDPSCGTGASCSPSSASSSGRTCTSSCSSIASTSSLPRSEAEAKLHSLVQKHAAEAVKVRRGLHSELIGAQATAALIRADRKDRYTFSTLSHNQVVFKADLLDEPDATWNSVNMLEALPPDESAFYSEERNVVSQCYSQEVFHQLTEQYAFVGGEYAEYVRYFNRRDMDPTLWTFLLPHEVRGTAGFSAVPKKSGAMRKLIMMVPSNYAWCDARGRAELGMHAGGILSQMYVPSGAWCVSGWDESNAFTAIRTPAWMWPWATTPPVRAGDVWDRLSALQQKHLSPAAWVHPAYRRLPMGGSHSVHILMSVNLHIVGTALTSSRKLRSAAPYEPSPCTTSTTCSSGTAGGGTGQNSEIHTGPVVRVIAASWGRRR